MGIITAYVTNGWKLFSGELLMKIEVELRKGDYYVELVEEYPTSNYLKAIRLALEKHSRAGYAVCKIRNLEPESSFTERVAESEFDPKN